MHKSNSIDSNSSSILRASIVSYQSHSKLPTRRLSTESGLIDSVKRSLDSGSKDKVRDRLVLKSFHELDVYRSTFDFVLKESEDPILSTLEKEQVSQAIQKLINHIEKFILALKAFKKQFIVLLSTIKFSQPHLHTFLVETLAKDASHILDAEAFLLAELNRVDASESTLTFGLIYKSWSRFTKYYAIASQHSLIACEILRKEAMHNTRLRMELSKPFGGYRSPAQLLEALAKRLTFQREQILEISSALPATHPEKNNLDQFAGKIQEILEFNELSSIVSDSSSSAPSLSSDGESPGEDEADSSSIILPQEIYKLQAARLEPLDELLLTEESYLKDLLVIDEVFIPAIKAACHVEERTPDLIINNLFYNYKALINLSRRLLMRLLQRKKDQPSMERIGDIMLEFTSGLHSFGDFGSHAQFSMRFWVNEKINNTFLSKCLKQAEEDHRSEKKALNTFLARPTYRLGQYPLILRQILKQTPPDSQEASDIIEALVRVESCLDVLNDLTDKEERRLQLRELQDRMFYKSGGINQFGLADESREIIFEGHLLKPPFGQRLKLFLFDHALLITRLKKVKSSELNEYELLKKPIPLDELYIEESSGLIKLALTRIQQEQSFTIVHLSKNKMDKFAVLTTCSAEKDIWVEKINEQRSKFMAQKGLAKYSLSH
ncbi:RHO1 GDP-GTP exchange protein 2 [Entomophthora muscae]|uniref:RHO1 GDP-GTP exchange protein 2 n=1 Tax=Entomophthora muscae TaxID=34485 RepID=A0ACC2SF97_9FUNG|nr:RHO1 GDP-GTP exchange protein 2 [Entomophthora muscae]